MRVGSLFSGIAGLDHGLAVALDAQPAWFCEVDPFCRELLSHRFPGVPVHPDVRELGYADDDWFVDVLCGGFPCQDVSLAGNGAGLAGARSGLWYEMLRVIELVRPSWVVIENVGALVKRGLATVLAGLQAAGYAAEWQTLEALAVGALHIRSRVFIVAYPDRAGAPQVFTDPSVVEDAFRRNRGGMWAREPAGVPRTIARAELAPRDRRARLKALGNAVVPQCGEVVGRCIREAMQRPRRPAGGRALGELREVASEWRVCGFGDLFGGRQVLDTPRWGRVSCGTVYEARALSTPAQAKARHAAMPGPFLSVPTPQAYAKGKPENSDPGLTPLDISVRGLYGRTILPTPTAGDANSSGSRNTASSSAHPGVSLTDVVRGDGGTGRAAGLLPTPTAATYGSSQNGINGKGGANERPSAGSPSLETMARRGTLPTPRASDWRSGKTSAATAGKNSRPFCELICALQAEDAPLRLRKPRRGRLLGLRAVRVARGQRGPRSAASGHLNPAWVEWLMGLPPGWVDVPFPLA